MRRGRIRARSRTQSSIAVSADGQSWILFDASPDILTQLLAFPEAQPARAIRDTAIVGIVLTDSQVDHTTGLLMLREGKPLKVYCTDSVHDDLSTTNPLFGILGHYCSVEWRRLHVPDITCFHVEGADGLSLRAVPLESRAPPYSTHRDDAHEGDSLGFQVTDQASGTTLFYAPGLGRIEPHLRIVFEDADCLLLDGTFWSDDEMIRLAISDQRAHDMGHLPQSGQGGMVDVLAGYPRARKILIHINNTNPILNEDSPERAQLASAGIEVAHDGMDFVV